MSFPSSKREDRGGSLAHSSYTHPPLLLYYSQFLTSQDISNLYNDLNRQVHAAWLHKKIRGGWPSLYWWSKCNVLMNKLNPIPHSCFIEQDDLCGIDLRYKSNAGSMVLVDGNNNGFVEIAKEIGCYELYTIGNQTYIKANWIDSIEACKLNEDFLHIESQLPKLSGENLNQLCMAMIDTRIKCALHNKIKCFGFLISAIKKIKSGNIDGCLMNLKYAARNSEIGLEFKTNLMHAKLLKARLTPSFIREIIETESNEELNAIKNELELAKKAIALYRALFEPKKSASKYQLEFIELLKNANDPFLQECTIVADSLVSGEFIEAWKVIYVVRSKIEYKYPTTVSSIFLNIAEAYLMWKQTT